MPLSADLEHLDFGVTMPVRQTGNIVEFTLEPVENQQRSKKEGHRVYEDKEMISIRAPGSKDVIQRVVTDKDRREYADKYDAFKKQQEAPSDGFPLREWPVLSRAEVLTLSALGMKTVEHVASVSDGNIKALGHQGFELRKKARDWLERTASNAPMEQLRTENEDLRNKLEVLSRAVSQLQREKGVEQQPLVEMPPPRVATNGAPKKRGRPAKATKEAV